MGGRGRSATPHALPARGFIRWHGAKVQQRSRALYGAAPRTIPGAVLKVGLRRTLAAGEAPQAVAQMQLAVLGAADHSPEVAARRADGLAFGSD